LAIQFEDTQNQFVGNMERGLPKSFHGLWKVEQPTSGGFQKNTENPDDGYSSKGGLPPGIAIVDDQPACVCKLSQGDSISLSSAKVIERAVRSQFVATYFEPSRLLR